MRSAATLPALLAITLLLAGGVASYPLPPPGSDRPSPGITQYVETRGGRISCWGVAIHLDRLTFRDTISADALVITEAKHHGDLRELMTWRVGGSGKHLLIQFKPGMGDFGSGNEITVVLDEAAFQPPTRDRKVIFTMTTDLI